MGNLDLEIGKSVRTLVDFVKSTVTNNLHGAFYENSFDISEQDLLKLSQIVTDSIDQAYRNGYIEVESVLKNRE